MKEFQYYLIAENIDYSNNCRMKFINNCSKFLKFNS